jgi:hypothetical protein
VVEHSIGNGEVDSSILSGSTIFLQTMHAARLSIADQHGVMDQCTITAPATAIVVTT